MSGFHDVSADERRRMIAEAAYHRAMARGFANGDPISDWLEAEREIDAGLNGGGGENWRHHLETRLSAAREDFGAFRRKAGGRAKAAKAEWKQEVERLGELLDKLEDRLDKVRERGGKATLKARSQAEKLWEEIAELRLRLAAKRKKSPPTAGSV